MDLWAGVWFMALRRNMAGDRPTEDSDNIKWGIYSAILIEFVLVAVCGTRLSNDVIK